MGQLLARHDTAALVATGQACFLTMMASCLAIEPSEIALKRGLSFYGTHLSTVVPYSLGFALCVGLTAAGIRRLSPVDASATRLRVGLAALSGMMALIPLTPYSIDLVFDYLHIGITSIVFTSGLALGAWLALRVLRTRLAQSALAAQLAAGLFALTAQLGWQDYMIPSQLGFQIALAVLVVLGIVRSAKRRAPAPTA